MATPELALDSLIEAVLFWRGEPVSISELAKDLGQSEEAIKTALIFLRGKLAERGVVLVEKNDEVLLGTAPLASEVIERLAKEELNRDLGKAALETLTIILYQGPVARAEIDYIRGVNSSFILRHLQGRGLAERIPNPADARSFLYRPTFDLLQHLGISQVEDLPEREALTKQLAEFVTTKKLAV